MVTLLLESLWGTVSSLRCGFSVGWQWTYNGLAVGSREVAIIYDDHQWRTFQLIQGMSDIVE